MRIKPWVPALCLIGVGFAFSAPARAATYGFQATQKVGTAQGSLLGNVKLDFDIRTKKLRAHDFQFAVYQNGKKIIRKVDCPEGDTELTGRTEVRYFSEGVVIEFRGCANDLAVLEEAGDPRSAIRKARMEIFCGKQLKDCFLSQQGLELGEPWFTFPTEFQFKPAGPAPHGAAPLTIK